MDIGPTGDRSSAIEREATSYPRGTRERRAERGSQLFARAWLDQLSTWPLTARFALRVSAPRFPTVISTLPAPSRYRPAKTHREERLSARTLDAKPLRRHGQIDRGLEHGTLRPRARGSRPLPVAASPSSEGSDFELPARYRHLDLEGDPAQRIARGGPGTHPLGVRERTSPAPRETERALRIECARRQRSCPPTLLQFRPPNRRRPPRVARGENRPGECRQPASAPLCPRSPALSSRA